MIDFSGFSPKQLQVIRESNARINLTHGAVRAGKTVGVNFRWVHYIHRAPPGGELVMIGKTERTLYRNVLLPLKAIFGDSLKISTGQGEAYLGGIRLLLYGANDERALEKIQGGTFAGAYGDEVTTWPESFFQMLISRLSVRGSKLFGTCNPAGPYHWLKKKFIDRSGEINLAHWPFHIDDNPYLPPEYVSDLKKEYTGVFYSRYIQGKWVLAEGLVYQDSPVVGVVRAPLDFEEFIVGVDYGTSNPCTFGLYGFDNGKPPVYLVREYYYDGGAEGSRQITDADYADAMQELVGTVRHKISNIYVDPSAASFITELKKRPGMPRVKGAKNDVLPGIRFVSGLIKQKMYCVDAGCVHTLPGYASYVWSPNAQKQGEDKPLKQDDHVCDRDRYALFSHFYKKTSKSGRKFYK